METPPVRKPSSESSQQASPVVLAICALVLLTAVGLRIKQAIELRTPLVAQAEVRGRTFEIEVADTAAKRELGLGERDSLPREKGMYFPFGTPQRWVFWMKGMRFPIDIIWINEGKIVDIEHSVPPPKVLPLDTYSPLQPADAVLEINAGLAKEIGLETGDEVVIRVP